MRHIIALDKSMRNYDSAGRLHVEKSHISKANISPYYGREIPNYDALGLDPDKVYQLYRDPVELERAAPSFERVPILRVHDAQAAFSKSYDPKDVIGAVGSNVEFNAPYLDADLSFWGEESIGAIESKQIVELSCGYEYEADMTPGEVDGKRYDGRMINIKGNHIALVPQGRAGSDVLVADSNPFKMESNMKMTKLGKALFASLSVASKVLAADSALATLVGNAERKTFNKQKVKESVLAMDATLSPEQLDNVIDALLDVEQEPKAQEVEAMDATPEEQIRAMLEGKVDQETIDKICGMMKPVAKDEDMEDKDMGMKAEEVKQAMDAMSESIRKEMREAEQAKRDVRDTVGDVIGMDSAAEVYGFALDQMGVDRKDVKGLASLRALYKVAASKSRDPQPAIAQDSGDIFKRFPELSRIKTK